MSYFWIVDDEQAICWSIKKALEKKGHRVMTFSNAEDALEALTDQPNVQAIMLDNRLPGMSGFDAAVVVKKHNPKLPIVMMTAFGDLSTAIQAMQIEVFEYLTKPFDLSDAVRSLENAVLSSSNQSHTTTVAEKIDSDILLGNSPSMQMVYKRIALAARSDVPVLISGEPGTGKESVAATIHKYSERARRPFLPFAPIALNPSTIDAELFGCIKNENSETTLTRSGIFELVGDGTVFIDEVTDLPISTQVQLLRILEHKQYLVAGDYSPRECRTRIIASTTRNLKSAVAEGELHPDLLVRLQAFSIELEPLNKRREDIAPLARAILARNASTRATSFSQEALVELEHRPWPGNIRELRNAVEFALTVARGNTIQVSDLPDESPNFSSGLSNSAIPGIDHLIREWVQQRLPKASSKNDCDPTNSSEDFIGTIHDDFLSLVEPALIRAALEQCDGNRAKVAEQLGLHRSTLRQKMRRYHID